MLGAHGCKAIDQGSRNIDGVGPESLPELVEAAERRRALRPRIRREKRNKELGQDGELSPLLGGLCDKGGRLLDRGFSVEDYRGGLNGGNACGLEVGHRPERSMAWKLSRGRAKGIGIRLGWSAGDESVCRRAGEVSQSGAWMPEEVIEPPRFLSHLAARGLGVQI